MKKGDEIIVKINGETFYGVIVENNGDTVSVDIEGMQTHVRVHKIACTLRKPNTMIEAGQLVSTDKDVDNTTVFSNWEGARRYMLANADVNVTKWNKEKSRISSLTK